MLKKYFSIVLLSLGVSVVSAQGISLASLGAETIGLNSGLQTTSSSLSALKAALTPLPYSGGRSGAEVSFCASVNVGADIVSVTVPGVSSSGSGLSVDVALGAAIQGGSRGKGQECSRVITIQLNYENFAAQVVTKDNSTGMSSTTSHGYSYVGLPVAYTGILRGGGRVGFYYQGGIAPEYVTKAQMANVNVIDHFSKIVVVPSVGAGITAVVAGNNRSHRMRKDQQIFLGAFASYTVNNMANDSNVGIHALTIGIRYFSMILN